MAYTTPQHTHTTVTDVAHTKPTDQPSIRSTIRGMLLEGRPTTEIAQAVKALAPESAAAAKSAAHIAWYRKQLRKEGLLPQVQR